jgi:hypothetical protein
LNPPPKDRESDRLVGEAAGGIKRLLEELADAPDRLVGVDTLSVAEHIWHHHPRPRKGPRKQTGFADPTRRNGKPRAQLLDLQPASAPPPLLMATLRPSPRTPALDVLLDGCRRSRPPMVILSEQPVRPTLAGLEAHAD